MFPRENCQNLETSPPAPFLPPPSPFIHCCQVPFPSALELGCCFEVWGFGEGVSPTLSNQVSSRVDPQLGPSVAHCQLVPNEGNQVQQSRNFTL